MTDPQAALDAILQGASVGPQQFAPNSRYYGLPTTTMTTPDGRMLSYLTRRFVPPPESFSVTPRMELKFEPVPLPYLKRRASALTRS